MFSRQARLQVDMMVGALVLTLRMDLEDWVQHHHRQLLKVYQQEVSKTRGTQMQDTKVEVFWPESHICLFIACGVGTPSQF